MLQSYSFSSPIWAKTHHKQNFSFSEKIVQVAGNNVYRLCKFRGKIKIFCTVYPKEATD